MVNEIIDDILLTEKQADMIVDEAREQAKVRLADLGAEIEKLYNDAEIKLKSSVETIIKNAEQEAVKTAAAKQEIVLKHIESIMSKAEGKFSQAVALVEKTFT